MSVDRAIEVCALLAVMTLVAPSIVPAQPPARHAVAGRCPVHRPAEGDACTREAQTCSWACGAEGSYDWGCSCTRSADDDQLHWRCTRGALCGE